MQWIPIDRPIIIPEAVKSVIQKLNQKGYVAYLVGGCVRDHLLDRKPKDFDVVTNATPDQIMEIYPDAITVGKAFGVIQVGTVEVATFRKDGDYKDGRHPESVQFSNPEEDAKRRDFTVNGLFLDTKTQKVLDYVGGFDDLKARKIRAIGMATQRFQEDALRLLRAVRFAANLGFEIEAETSRAIKNRSKLIRRISGERIRVELEKIWEGPSPHTAIRSLKEAELTDSLFPEIEAQHWDGIFALFDKIKTLPSPRSSLLSWAALGRDQKGTSQVIAGSLMSRFKLSHDQFEKLAWILEERAKFKEVFLMREATLQRWVSHAYFEDALSFHWCEVMASDGNQIYYEFCLSRLEEYRKQGDAWKDKLLDGKDLIQLGLKPGPQFTEILRSVEDLVLEKKIHTKEEALEYVLNHFMDG